MIKELEKKEKVQETDVKKEETPVAEVDMDTLNKSFNDSRDSLLALLGVGEEDKEEDLEKAKKKGKEKEEDDDEDDEDDEDEDMEYEEEEEGKKKVKKSLDDVMVEDEETETAMDIEPFLRQFSKSFSDQIEILKKEIKKVRQELTKSLELQKATSKMFVDYGSLQKAMAETVEKIGNTPIKSGSILRKSGGKESVLTAPDGTMTRDTVLSKAMQLSREGKLSPLEFTKIEGRLNAGIPLTEDIVNMIKEVK